MLEKARRRLLDGTRTVDRREFTLQAALAILAGVTITVGEACGGSSNSTSPTPAPSDVNGAISANHGHIAVITGAEITAANAISLNIQGTATHPHTVDISQSDLRSLLSKQAVSHDSSNNSGHMHTVTFTP
jgi:hypothetical protein